MKMTPFSLPLERRQLFTHDGGQGGETLYSLVLDPLPTILVPPA